MMRRVAEFSFANKWVCSNAVYYASPEIRAKLKT